MDPIRDRERLWFQKRHDGKKQGKGAYKNGELQMDFLRVDSETFLELSQTCDALTECLSWLMERRDILGYRKIAPIVGKLNDLILAILEGNFPEISPSIEALNRFQDEIKERMRQVTTFEEFERLHKQLQEACEKIQTVLEKVKPGKQKDS
jgi:hypothetical protein